MCELGADYPPDTEMLWRREDGKMSALDAYLLLFLSSEMESMLPCKHVNNDLVSLKVRNPALPDQLEN